ncbi:MAG: redoxin domain-containing protein [bacterium]|nr:redoxin domain-containing protein [bacterium]
MSSLSMPPRLLANAARLGASSGTLRVGDAAPDFELAGSDGQQYSLAQYRGERAVVLVWFPRAFTPG